MPSSRLQWRALAALGALLLVISVWPLTCAALPIELLTFQSNASNQNAAILSNLTNNQRIYPNSEMTPYKSEIRKIKSEQYSSQLHDDIIRMPMLKTAFLQRKRKKINSNNNRSTSYTIKNYFNAARTTIIQKKESTLSSTPQTLHSNDLYLASTTPSSLSITTYQPVVGLGKLSLNNSLRLSQTTMRDDETITSVSTTQITTSIKLNQNQTVDNNASSHMQLNSNRNYGLRFKVPTMFLNQTIAPTLQTVFSMNNRNDGSKRVKMTTTESIFSRTERSISTQMRSHGRKLASGKRDSNLDRNERSTNFSHITGTSRKIQLLIKNRLLQLLPDGTVNGTQDDGSDYTILQRATVDVGKIRIQGVATCLFLCMDTCGNVYGAFIKTILLRCTNDFNTKYFENVTSNCRRLNRTTTQVIVDGYIPKGIQHDAPIFLEFVTYKRFTTQYKPILIKVTEELCAIGNFRNSPILEKIFGENEAETNFFDPCPLRGHLYARHTITNSRFSKFPPLIPVGEWRVDTYLYKIVNGSREKMVNFYDFLEVTATGALDF